MKMAEWISVEDRLPDSSRYCWVTLRMTREVAITWYDPYEPEWDQFGSSIVAWMYVEGKPEPYKPTKGVKSNEERKKI